MSKKLRPLRNGVMIEVKRTTKTASGIILAEGAQETEKFAVIVATGPDVTDVKVGDRVLYDIYSGIIVEEEPNRIVSLVEDTAIIGVYE